MNIGIGKFGKSVLFDFKKWDMIGGSEEAPVMFSSLAQMNPDVKFYLIGRSDFSRLDADYRDKINPHGNIIDIWQHYDHKKYKVEDFIVNYLGENNIELDRAILYAGPTPLVSVPGRTYNIVGDTNKIADVFETFLNYVGPLVHYLNTTGIQYDCIGEDYRYFPIRDRDLFNQNARYRGTTSKKLTTKYCPHYGAREIVSKEFDVVHSRADLVFLMGEEPNRDLKFDPTRSGMSIYSNGRWTTGGIPKWPILNDWIIEPLDLDFWNVYGLWKDDVLGNINLKHKFINAPINSLHEQMLKTKYTFMIPITQNNVSSKLWKMIYFGIVPFFHPESDCENVQIKDDFLNKWLKPKTPEQMKEHIDLIDKDVDLYHNICSRLQSLLEPEFFNGSLINKIFMERDPISHIENKLSSLYSSKNVKNYAISKTHNSLEVFF